MATTNLFDRIVEETAKLASIPADNIPLSKGRLKRWTDLAAYWETQPNSFPNLFYEAIFHIARGRYSHASASVKPLLALIEEALLNDVDALSQWRRINAFKDAFSLVTIDIHHVPYSKQRWKSSVMRDFVECRLYALLIYRNSPIPMLTLKLSRNRRAYMSIVKQLEIQSPYTRFVEIMELLVPGCHNWSTYQWTSEAYIFSQIQAAHGIDYSKNIVEFDKMMTMFRYKLEGIPYYRNLFSIKLLPSSIAAIIWPDGIEKNICKQFSTACRVHPYMALGGGISSFDPIIPQNMVKSWAFNQMEAWRKNNSYKLSRTVRGNMLNIALGNHPRLIKEAARLAA